MIYEFKKINNFKQLSISANDSKKEKN